MSTSCEIQLNLIDVAAKNDSALSATNITSFSDINSLKKEENEIDDYMTGEWNYSILDGSLLHLPDVLTDIYPFISQELSDENRERVNEPTLSIDFTQNHSSSGITLSFQGDYPQEVRIVWKNEFDSVLSDMRFYPNSTIFFCENSVDNYQHIYMYFDKSNAPYRYLKITDIDYGSKLIFDEERISSARLLEELDPISSELSINEVSFTLLDTDKNFNILSPRGKYQFLQKKQKVVVHEYVNDVVKNMGTFYLSQWKSNSETEISFTAIDAIGLLDQTKFLKGRIYNNEPVGNIIAEIMESAGWDKYEIAEGLSDVLLSGYIPICTHREALQLVVFSIRAVADCSRSDMIRIYRTVTAADSKVNYDRQFDQASISVRNYVNSIAVTTHNYSLSDETEKVFDGILQVGISEIMFSEPCTNLTISGGTIVESGVNYALVNVSVEGNVTITGNKYIDTTSTFIKSVTVDAGEVKTVVEVNDATLISSNNAYLLAEHLFDYYNYRRMAEQEFLLEQEVVGRWINLRTQYELFISGIVTKQDIDLTGGFIATTTIIGYNTFDTDFVFTGSEMFTGEKIGVV